MICPNCGQRLFKASDEHDNYLTCPACVREYNYDLSPRRMTINELTERTGVTFVNGNVR